MPKLHLLDASVLITAKDSYYPIDRVPEYWAWLRHMGQRGEVKMPLEQFEEIKEGPDDGEKDLLFGWLQEDENKKALLLDEEVDGELVKRVVAEGYAPDLTDDEIEKLGRDPFLIAYGLKDPSERRIVTVEVRKPKKQRANRKVPDICELLRVQWCDPHMMNRDLDFRTNWKK